MTRPGPSAHSEKRDRRPSSRESWFESKRFPWVVAGVYAVVVLWLFREFVFSDLMLYGSDTMQAVVYFREFYVTAVRAGIFPMWSPYLFGGMPFVDAFHSDIGVSQNIFMLCPNRRLFSRSSILATFLGTAHT